MANINNQKDVKIPDIHNEKLAELIGIHLGDGTLTKYFIRISGDKRYDYHYFNYLSSLAEEVFGFKPIIRTERNRNILYIEILSKQVCNFFNNILKIPYGNKIDNSAKIPEFIMSNTNLSIACLRGLVDTDGSICRRDKSICLAFNSYNKSLLKQVAQLNRKHRLFTHQCKDEIGTNSWKQIIKFYKLVGSSNLRHIIRFCEKYYNNKNLYKQDVLKYLNKYKDTKLPYRL